MILKITPCTLFLVSVISSSVVLGHSISNRGNHQAFHSDASGSDWMHRSNPSSPVNGKDAVFEFEDAKYWIDGAQATLAEKLKVDEIEKEAKNVIFFLGDGMSLPTLTASRIHKGQLEGSVFGEEATLFFESFPYTGLSKTFCSDSQVADSACSATAYLTGTKANIKTIGVKPSVQFKDCQGQMNKANQVDSVLAWAQAAGKSTGVVTTTRITHASPAGTYAHIADRDWENDRLVTSSGNDAEFCDDIAEQLILREPGQNINVILGGGRREFIPQTERDPETLAKGNRGDGVNLIQKWIDLKADKRAKYVWNRTEFEAVDPQQTDYLLGLFEPSHLDYVLDSDEDPSLPDLVEKAVGILSKNPKGYFLFVEGGRIDHAHHENKAQKAFVETITMDNAVKKAVSLTNVEDTMILVTSDHAHTMSILGYPGRGRNILEKTGSNGSDGLPYTTLSYSNGPGYNMPKKNGDRYDMTNDNTTTKNYMQMTGLPLFTETHGGDDVMIFARGPFSHLFNGVVQQSYIPHVIGYASCTGTGIKFCDE